MVFLFFFFFLFGNGILSDGYSFPMRRDTQPAISKAAAWPFVMLFSCLLFFFVSSSSGCLLCWRI